MCTVSDATETAAASASNAFPQRLISRLIEQPSRADAQHDRSADAPMHRGNQLGPLALAEIGKADGNDQEGFEPFAKGDDKRLQHMICFRQRPA